MTSNQPTDDEVTSTIDEAVGLSASATDACYEAWAALTEAVDREELTSSVSGLKQFVGTVTELLQGELLDVREALHGRAGAERIDSLPNLDEATDRLEILLDPSHPQYDVARLASAFQYCLIIVQTIGRLTTAIPELTASRVTFVAPDSWNEINLMEFDTVSRLSECWNNLRNALNEYIKVKAQVLGGTPSDVMRFDSAEQRVARGFQLVNDGFIEGIAWAASGLRIHINGETESLDVPAGSSAQERLAFAESMGESSGVDVRAAALVFEAEKQWLLGAATAPGTVWLACSVAAAALFKDEDPRDGTTTTQS